MDGVYHKWYVRQWQQAVRQNNSVPPARWSAQRLDQPPRYEVGCIRLLGNARSALRCLKSSFPAHGVSIVYQH